MDAPGGTKRDTRFTNSCSRRPRASSFAGPVGLEALAFELMDKQDHLVARTPEPNLSVGGAIR